MTWFEKLKFARKVSKLTLRELEEKTGISNAYLSQLENGQIKDPSFFKMIELIRFYGLDHSDFEDVKPSEGFIMTVNGPGPHRVACPTCGTHHMEGAMCHECFRVNNSKII